MTEYVKTITPDEFKAGIEFLHSAIFSGREYSEVLEERYMPFVDSSWEKVLIPDNIFCLDDVTSRALTHAAMKMGDDHVIVTESESLPHYERTFKVVWDQEALRGLRDFSDIAHFELHVFGMSGRWGMMCYYDEFSLLGGTPDFMEDFFKSAGGPQRVKERFIQHAMEAWVIDPIAQIKILRSVGWSFSSE